jgi:hypothetical protein
LIRESADPKIFKKETSMVLFEFYCELTISSDTQFGRRTFQDCYNAASTIHPSVLKWLGTVFSTPEYKAFTMAQFQAMHSFKGAPYGWDKIHLVPEFQVEMCSCAVQFPNIIFSSLFVFVVL